jgi:hypothetical protein
MISLVAFIYLLSLTAATITIEDPSDNNKPKSWAVDNARLADYHVQPILYQVIPTVGKYVYNGTSGTTISHETFSVDKNDTSVIVVTDGASVNIEYANIVKFGYASNLLQSSFFGRCNSFTAEKTILDD